MKEIMTQLAQIIDPSEIIDNITMKDRGITEGPLCLEWRRGSGSI